MKKYIHELGPLFEAVQMQQIFPDGKTFPDCLPKGDLDDIAQRYVVESRQPEFDLAAFVAAHFDTPKAEHADYQSDASRTAEQHIVALWPVLTRQPDSEQGGSLLLLPHPYIVPGGRFREIYYWDSYFTMLGLRASGRTDLMQHMVDNFAHLIHHVGHVPNGNRAYYLSRSQPPFFALMVDLLAAEQGEGTWVKYFPALQREHEFWMSGQTLHPSHSEHRRCVRMPDGSVLNRYWDDLDTPRPESYREDVELAHESGRPPAEVYRHIRAAAESGWDFSSRWFDPTPSPSPNGRGDTTNTATNKTSEEASTYVASPLPLGEGSGVGLFSTIHTTDLIPVDLNCLLWFLEKKLADTCVALGDDAAAERYYAAAILRADAIQQYCWDETAGFYFDFDFKSGERSPHLTLAGVFPLFFNLAPLAAAECVAGILKEKFLQTGGLSTTLQRSGQQWDAPNGWAPLQWMAYQGLLNYDQHDLAAAVRDRWTANCRQVYQHTGKMMEKYNVFGEGGEGGGGEYPNQDGFGWSNGVFLAVI